jgi:VWFA-related protein
MRTIRRKILHVTVPALLTTAVLAGQQAPRTGQQTPTFRSTTDLITTDVVVRDKDGKFIPDLRLDEFQVFEDGVPQKIVGFVRNIGGRVLTDISPTMAPVSEGLILPPTKQGSDTSGRIFIIFIDDLHLQALDSPQVRRVLGMIRDTVIHENDLVGLVSTGYSSIEVDVQYDYQHRRFNESIKKVMGSGMTPVEIIQANQTAQGPAGLRHNTHVAFSTAYDMLTQAEKITNRRKAFIYVSNGYDFNPFKDSRYKYEQEKYAMPLQDANNSGGDATGGSNTAGPDPAGSYDNPFERDGQQFAETDLISEVAELVRAARRANVTFYTVDPRGLDAGPSIAYNLSMEEWRRFVDTSVSSLRVLADETGGHCICMTNNFEKGLQEIDNAMSDYYLLGYVSSNPDPLRVRRRIEIQVTRPGAQKPKYTAEYTLKRPNKRK